MEITVNTDGASRGNPGKSAIAYVIKGISDEVIEFAKVIGETTNNQAEYQALIAALEKILEENVKNSNIVFNLDSELVVKQIEGLYKVKNAQLKPVYDDATSLIKNIEHNGNLTSFVAIRRENNKRPDELANLALDGKI